MRATERGNFVGTRGGVCGVCGVLGKSPWQVQKVAHVRFHETQCLSSVVYVCLFHVTVCKQQPIHPKCGIPGKV